MLRTRILVGACVFLLSGVTGTVLIALAAGSGKEAVYTGSDKCKLCHFKEHKTWSNTKHATNFGVLKGDEQKNPDCLKCHTTGYGKPGGFVSLDETPNLANAGCEACHGPGSAHNEAAKDAPEKGSWDKKIDKVPQNSCVGCHNPHVNQKERVAKLRGEG